MTSPLLADRVQETTTTTGTGTLTLGGATTGCRTFNSAFSNGNVVYYVIDDGAGNWEVGSGTVETGTLTRDTVYVSSNAGAKVSFAAGSKTVYCDASANVFPSGNVVGTSDAQTLTNKTFTNPIINGFIGDTSAINIGSGQLVKDTAGNLGLGVTPSAWNTPAFNFGSNAVGSLSVIGTTTSLGNNINYNSGYKYTTSSTAGLYQISGNTHYWFNAPSGTAGNAISFTQAMTLDASDNLLVGTTSAITGGSGLYRMVMSANGTNLWGVGPYSTAPTNFYVSNNANTGVYLAYGNTSWTANSDERLKTDLKAIENATQKVSTLRAVTGRYIADEEGISRSFLIAQDVQAVLPEAVDTSDPDRLGVQYTDTIPLLVAAIKELSAELNELKKRVNA